MCCFSFNHSVAFCLQDCRALQGAIRWFYFRQLNRRRRLLIYLFGHSLLFFNILLLGRSQRVETSLHLDRGVNRHSSVKISILACEKQCFYLEGIFLKIGRRDNIAAHAWIKPCQGLERAGGRASRWPL